MSKAAPEEDVLRCIEQLSRQPTIDPWLLKRAVPGVGVETARVAICRHKIYQEERRSRRTRARVVSDLARKFCVNIGEEVSRKLALGDSLTDAENEYVIQRFFESDVELTVDDCTFLLGGRARRDYEKVLFYLGKKEPVLDNATLIEDCILKEDWPVAAGMGYGLNIAYHFKYRADKGRCRTIDSLAIDLQEPFLSGFKTRLSRFTALKEECLRRDDGQHDEVKNSATKGDVERLEALERKIDLILTMLTNLEVRLQGRPLENNTSDAQPSSHCEGTVEEDLFKINDNVNLGKVLATVEESVRKEAKPTLHAGKTETYTYQVGVKDTEKSEFPPGFLDPTPEIDVEYLKSLLNERYR